MNQLYDSSQALFLHIDRVRIFLSSPDHVKQEIQEQMNETIELFGRKNRLLPGDEY